MLESVPVCPSLSLSHSHSHTHTHTHTHTHCVGSVYMCKCTFEYILRGQLFCHLIRDLDPKAFRTARGVFDRKMWRSFWIIWYMIMMSSKLKTQAADSWTVMSGQRAHYHYQPCIFKRYTYIHFLGKQKHTRLSRCHAEPANNFYTRLPWLIVGFCFRLDKVVTLTISPTFQA